MILPSSSALVAFFFTLPISLGIAFLYYSWVYYYSKNSHVPWVFKPMFPFGNILIIKADNLGIQIGKWHSLAKKAGYKIVKAYHAFIPIYILVDPKYIKHISQREFAHFHDRGLLLNEKVDPLSANLLTFSGERWKFMRAKLSPSFSSRNIRSMFDTLLQCGRQLEETVENKQVIHLNELATCYTINVIGSYAFGIDCNAFKDPNMEFRKQGEQVFCLNWYRAMKIGFGFGFPNVSQKLGIRTFSQKSTDFFINLVKEVMQYRLENNVTRKDMLQILMEINKKDDKTGMDQINFEDFNYNEITAQMFLFFAAGFETSSVTITHSLYELALNCDIQNKLRKEILQVMQANDGKITYDTLTEMKYMSQVIDETLRKYPPLMYAFRTAAKDYTIPGTDIELSTGTRVFYSILGIHRDPEYYPDPEKFDPQRFSIKNKKRIPSYAFLPYGEGPRMCIANRLAMFQIKIALAFLLKTYRVSLNEKTELPLEYQGLSLSYNPSTQIYLNVERVGPTT